MENISREHLRSKKALPHCPLLERQRNSLVAHHNALSSAVRETLSLFADLHDFGVLLSALRSWKRPVASQWTNSSNHLYPWVDGDTVHFLGLTISSLGSSSAGYNKCKDERFCRDANRTLTYFDRLPFILPAKKHKLRHLVGLICRNISSLENNRVHGGSAGEMDPCAVTGASVCVQNLTLNCSKDFFIRTSQSHLSFSPEMVHHDYIIRTIGSLLIDRNWSKSVSKPWCRTACIPGSRDELYAVQTMANVGIHANNAILLMIVSFACYLIFSDKRNLYRMTRNPRRTYLYLNVVAVLTQLFYYIGNVTPKEGYWCDRDGSVVIDTKDASPVCKLQASIGLTLNAVQVIVQIWVAFEWTRTMFNLHKNYRLTEDVFCLNWTVHELVELCVMITTILISVAIIIVPVLAEDLFIFQVEGLPAMKVCVYFGYFESPALYGSYLVVNAIVGFSFFVFSRVLWNLTLRREQTCGAMYRAAHQRDNHASILRNWLNRHVLFGTVLFGKAVVYSSFFFEIVFSRTKNSPRALSDTYRSCLHSLQCPESCVFRPPPSDISPPAVFAFVVLCLLNYAEFAWIFFEEIDWNCLSRFRPAFRI